MTRRAAGANGWDAARRPTDRLGALGEPWSEAHSQRATLDGVHERFEWIRGRWLLILVLLIIVVGLAAALLGHNTNNAYP
jgi:hypothetical protein